VFWIINGNGQIVGIALSWGNLRSGLLIFPEGRPLDFKIENGFESPASDIIIVHTDS
jgi:hypothetical protein